MGAVSIDRIMEWRVVGATVAVCLCVWVGAAAFSGLSALLALPSDSGAFLRAPATLLTYSFVHTDPHHLIANLAALMLVGIPLERIAGSRLTAVVIAAGAITGGIAYLCSASIPGWEGRLGGISAATLAAGMALAVVRPRAGVIAGAGLLFLLSLWGNTPPQTAAHVAGGVAGAIVMLLHRHAAHPTCGEIVRKAARSGYASLSAAERTRLIANNSTRGGGGKA